MNYSFRLSVIIPVFNEKNTILKIVDNLLLQKDLNQSDIQFIIIDDGSVDGTVEIIKNSNFKNDVRFTCIFHEKNQGKGAAIRTGLKIASGVYSIIQDADLEYDPGDIVKLLHKAETENLAVVFGSRNLGSSAHGTAMFYWGGRLVTAVTNLLYDTNLTDEPTCYKLAKTELLQSLPLTCTGFEFCPQVTAMIANKDIKIEEIPISYHPRDITEGKKIRWHDGIEAIWELVRLRFKKENWQGLLIFVLIFGVYLLSWNRTVGGYEPDTMLAASALGHGRYLLMKPAIGSSLFYVPFIFLFHLLPLDNIYKALTLVPIFYSAWAMVMIFFIVNELGIKKSVNIAMTILVALGSVVWPYAKLGMEYQEMFVISWLLFFLIRWSKQRCSPLLVGATVGFLALVKSYGAVFMLPTILFIFTTLYHQGRQKDFFRLSFLLKLFAPIFVTVFYILSINLLLAGGLSGAYSLAHEFQIWSWWDGIWGVFFGFGKSILVYSPLLILAIFYWPQFYKKFPAVSVFVLTGFLLYFLITAPFSYWSDETPSVRKLVPLIPFLHLPLFYVLDFFISQKKKISLTFFALLSLLAMYVQIGGSLYPYFRYMVLVRTGNADTLEQMRYNPQVSEVYVNHRLLVSYLQRKLLNLSVGQFEYNESTWMRHFQAEGTKDFTVFDVAFDLEKWDTPSTYMIMAENKSVRNLILAVDLLLIGYAGFYLFFSAKD